MDEIDGLQRERLGNDTGKRGQLFMNLAHPETMKMVARKTYNAVARPGGRAGEPERVRKNGDR